MTGELKNQGTVNKKKVQRIMQQNWSLQVTSFTRKKP